MYFTVQYYFVSLMLIQTLENKRSISWIHQKKNPSINNKKTIDEGSKHQF